MKVDVLEVGEEIQPEETINIEQSEATDHRDIKTRKGLAVGCQSLK